LVKAITDYEAEFNKELIEKEKESYVATKVGKTEAGLQGDLRLFQGLIDDETAKILAAETELRALDGEYAAYQRKKEENLIEENKIESERRLLATDTLNTFNRLNQGRVQIQREPQETDEELLIRLESLGKIPVDSSDVENQILAKAKKNILELTSDVTKGEIVLKSLSSDEQHIMNKIFPKIKKNFSETFGLNNKSLSDADITQFIQNEISNNPIQVKVKPVEAGAEESKADAAPTVEETKGEGLPHRVLPSKFVFGKIKIDLNKLFYRNILSITDGKGKQINGQMGI